jgi:hypothetical protein
MFKSVLVRDRVNVQFRAETFNTPLFAGPNTAFGSANFGLLLLKQIFRAIFNSDCTSPTNEMSDVFLSAIF